MSLPGKLSIGFLQEDNPAKYFFRLRPILVKEDEGFQTLDNLNERYPQDGFIRIVPDKNEISHFKARMRALGRYCMLNLTRHPNENDKIRPNKNFAMVSTERNANIVYSDVVAKLPRPPWWPRWWPLRRGRFCPNCRHGLVVLSE